MYIFPGYTRYYEENGAIYVTSDVYQSTIKLSDSTFQKEFYSMVQTGGCQSLASPLAVFLHEQGLIANKDEICTVLEQTRKLLEDTLMITILPQNAVILDVHTAMNPMFRPVCAGKHWISS